MQVSEWQSKGELIEVAKKHLFVIDSDKQNLANKPLLCILHGFPTSSFDYWKVLEQLQQKFRVVIHDHLGFGFSDKPLDYSYSLIDQADMALALWKQLKIKQAYILAHDYGTSILTEILVRDNQACCPIKIQKVALCNGSMHIELAKLKLMQKLLRNRLFGHLIARFASKPTLKKNLRDTFYDKSQLSNQELDGIWEMMNFNQGRQVLAKISQYTYERETFWHRWIGALQETEIRLEIIWPENDPIAVAQMAKVILRETKNSDLYWLKKTGHFPMLEAPEIWTNTVCERLLR
ncbi:MAG: alpha/beta hydrolase [Kangiellaceae bacterium]